MASDFGTALRGLRSAQKSSKGVSYYSRWINRPLGRVFAAAGYVTGLTPNAVTAISALVTGCGVALITLARPSWPVTAAVVALLVLGFALDSADGQLARLRGKGSRSGEWLDHVVDCVKMLTLHLAILVAMFRFFRPEPSGWLLLPLAFQVTAVTTFFGGILTEQLKRTPGVRGAPAPPPSVLRSLLLLPADYGVFCVLFLSWGAGRTAFLWVYGVLLAANVLLMLALLVKWFRELSRPMENVTASGPVAGDPAHGAPEPAALS